MDVVSADKWPHPNAVALWCCRHCNATIETAAWEGTINHKAETIIVRCPCCREYDNVDRDNFITRQPSFWESMFSWLR